MNCNIVYRLADGIINEDTMVYTKQGENWLLNHRIPKVRIFSVLDKLKAEDIEFKYNNDIVEIVGDLNLLKINMLFKQAIIEKLENKINDLMQENKQLRFQNNSRQKHI